MIDFWLPTLFYPSTEGPPLMIFTLVIAFLHPLKVPHPANSCPYIDGATSLLAGLKVLTGAQPTLLLPCSQSCTPGIFRKNNSCMWSLHACRSTRMQICGYLSEVDCIIVQVVGLALNRGVLSKFLSLAQTIAVLSGPVSFEEAGNKQSASRPFAPSLIKVPFLVLLLHVETYLRDSMGLEQQLHHLLYGEAAKLKLLPVLAA